MLCCAKAIRTAWYNGSYFRHEANVDEGRGGESRYRLHAFSRECYLRAFRLPWGTGGRVLHKSCCRRPINLSILALHPFKCLQVAAWKHAQTVSPRFLKHYVQRLSAVSQRYTPQYFGQPCCAAGDDTAAQFPPFLVRLSSCLVIAKRVPLIVEYLAE